jgi:tRNA(adenine34) deaminase
MKPHMPFDHQRHMLTALYEAEKAQQIDEVPIGATIFSSSGKMIAEAHNQVITRQDPTAHAEVLALRQACRKMGNYRLPGTTLYVTVEPCPMCMGAIIHARVERIVFGAFDVKWGAVGSLYNMASDARLNHHVEVVSGILENPCRQLMQDFFRSKRNQSSDN